MENKPLILIIDDTADFRDIFSLELASAGFRVITAVNGEDGLRRIKSDHPNLVLLDMEMPSMNGAETMAKIEDDLSIKNTKVVFLTSHGDPIDSSAWSDSKFAKEFGAADYIRKTDDFQKIIKHIKEIT